MKIKNVLFVAAVCVLAALTSCGGSKKGILLVIPLGFQERKPQPFPMAQPKQKAPGQADWGLFVYWR